ncbi:MAG: hypothetical protein AAB383_03735 [Patescibacteria group bacterium]
MEKFPEALWREVGDRADACRRPDLKLFSDEQPWLQTISEFNAAPKEKAEGGERLHAEAQAFWTEYRDRLLAVYEGVFLPWARAEEPDVKVFSEWLSSGAYAFDGFYDEAAANDKDHGGFDLSLFQDSHETQTIPGDLNHYFETNELIRSRADWKEFLIGLEKGVSRFFENPESENIDLAVQNAEEILKRLVASAKRGFKPEEALAYLEKFKKLVQNNPSLSEGNRLRMLNLLSKTHSKELDQAIVLFAIELAEGVDPKLGLLERSLSTAIITPLGEGEDPAVEHEGWYKTQMDDSIDQLTSLERMGGAIDSLLQKGDIEGALKISRLSSRHRISSSKDPCSDLQIYNLPDRESALQSLIAPFGDPELKLRIEREVHKAWTSPRVFRTDERENLTIRAFWLDLVERGREKHWPEAIISALYDNAVHYRYTVGTGFLGSRMN